MELEDILTDMDLALLTPRQLAAYLDQLFYSGVNPEEGVIGDARASARAHLFRKAAIEAVNYCHPKKGTGMGCECNQLRMKFGIPY